MSNASRFVGVVSSTLMVIKYIFHHNSPWLIPCRAISAAFVQGIMLVTKQPFQITIWNGKKLLLFPGSSVTNMFLYTNRPDRIEVDLLRQYCTEETVFLDIGAHLGTYSVQLADVTTHIYGFEADVKCAEKCRMNYELNNLNPNQVITKAVAAHSGTLHLYLDSHDGTQNSLVKHPNATVIEVDAISIDQFLAAQSNKSASIVMKIDVEGAEAEVIKGAMKTLKKNIVPIIIFESFHPKTHPLFSQLKQLGYKIAKVSHNNYSAIKTN